MIKKNAIEKLLEVYASQNDDIHIERTISFVSQNENLFGRDNLSGHITGSAWVLNDTKDKVLLIHHKKLNLWLQPGGHVDEDDLTVIETASREAIEETGLKSIQLLSSELFDLDVHLIPERKNIPAHYHYDFRFIFKTESKELNANFSEVNDIRWFDIDKIVNSENYGSINLMAQKSLEY